MKNWKLLLITTVVALFVTACTEAPAPADSANKKDNDKPKKVASKPAGATTCVISGKALDDSAFVHTHTDEESKEKSELKLCCQDCMAKFNEDPDLYLAKYANQLDGYKTEICIVSDEPLGSMGKPIVHKHKDGDTEVLVKFCCGGCVDEFKEDPAKFLAKLEKATSGGASKPEEKPKEKEGEKDKEGEKQ